MKRRLFVLGLIALVSVACKKKATPETEAESAALLEVGALPLPEDVVAYGGLKSFDNFVSTVTNIVQQFSPEAAPTLNAQMSALLQGQLLGVRGLTWFDTSKSLLFIVLDYKKFENPLVLVLPLKGKPDELKAALPENKADASPDNQFRYSTLLGEQIFVNVLGDKAVFTFHDKAFAVAKPFIEGPAGRLRYQELVDVQFSVQNFRRIAGDDLKDLREEIVSERPPAGFALPGVKELFLKEMDMVFDLLEQSEVARLTLSFDGSNLVMHASAKVVEGRTLGSFAQSTKERKITLHKSLPAGGWLVGAGNVDPKLFEGWFRLGFDFYSAFLELNEEDKKKLEQLFGQALELQTGESAFYIGKEGELPIRVISITAVRDGEKARANLDQMLTLILARAGAVMQKAIGAEALDALKKLDFSTPKVFLEGLKPLLADQGVSLALREETIQGVRVSAVELSVDYEKAAKAIPPKDTEAVKALIGQKVGFAIGSDKSNLYFVIGANAVEDLVKISRGELGKGEQSALDALITQAGFRVAFAGYFSLRELLRFISKLESSLPEDMPGLETTKDAIRVALLVGAHGDRIIDVSLHLPVGGLASLKRPPQPLAPAP